MVGVGSPLLQELLAFAGRSIDLQSQQQLAATQRPSDTVHHHTWGLHSSFRPIETLGTP